MISHLYSALTAALLVSSIPLCSSGQSFQDAAAGLEPLYDGRISWSDLDNDGDPDIIYSGLADETTFYTRVYENVAGVFNLRATVLPHVHGEIVPGDYDNDGDPDILLSGRTPSGNVSELYENTGAFNFTLKTSFQGLTHSKISWADPDNDEDADIIITGVDDSVLPAVDKTLVYRNDGGTFTELTTTGLPACSQCSFDWADVNGDGLSDVVLTSVVRNNARHTELYLNNGGNTFTLDASQPLPGLYGGDVRWGDFDRDGQMDLLVSGARADGSMNTEVYRNDSGRLQWIDALDLWYVGENRHRGSKWVDYNNDGWQDIVLTGRGTSVFEEEYVLKGYLNQGDTTFTEEDLATDGRAYSSIDFGDYDNDGDVDMVYMGKSSTGVVTGVLKNTLHNTPYVSNTRPSPPSAASMKESFYRKSVRLSWSEGADAQTPAAALSYNFRLQRGATMVVVPMANVTTGYLTSDNSPNGYARQIVMPDLPEGDYTWAVQSIDGARTGSLFTTARSFHLLKGPEALKAEIVDETHVKLNWVDHSGTETSYRIERSTSLATGFITRATPAANASMYTDNFAFATETPYYYRIFAVDATGSSGYDSLMVLIPTKPANVGAREIHAARMIITWDDNSNHELGYTIERKLATASTFEVLDTLDADAVEYYDTGLLEGSEYVYRVRAINENGYSAYSDAATIPSNFRPRGTDVVVNGVEDNNVTFTDDDFANNFTDQDVEDTFREIYVSALPQRGTLKLADTPVTAGQRIMRSSLSTLSYSPAPDNNGLHTFSFYFSDGKDSSDVAYQAKITLTAVNDAPMFTIPDRLILDEDFEAQTIVPDIHTPEDEQSQPITWTLTPEDPENIIAEVDAATGAIKLTPVSEASGTWQFTLTANDGQAGDNTYSATIEIVVRAVNDAPLIGEIGDIIAEKRQPIPPITLNISDPDSPAESILLGVTSDNQSVVKDSKMRIDGNVLTITPELKVGTAVITVRATDGIAVSTRTFKVEVGAITAVEKSAPGVSIYPNPVETVLNIAIDEYLSPPFRLLVRDAAGRLIMTHDVNSPFTQVDFGSLRAGVYFLALVTPDDKVLYSGRIAKSK